MEFVDYVKVQRLGNLVAADSLNLVRVAFRALLVATVIGVDGPLGVSCDDSDARVFLLEVPAGTAHRTPGPRGAHQVSDPVFGLLPQLRSSRAVVGLDVGLIVELVSEHCIGRALDDRLGLHHVVVGVVGWNRCGRDDDFRAERSQETHLFLRHLVGHGEDAAIAFERRGHRQGDASVARGSLHDDAAGRQLSPPLSVLDDGNPDTVFHGAAGIEELRLAEDRRADVPCNLVQPDQRCPSDCVEHVGVPIGTYMRHDCSPDPDRTGCRK